MSGYQKIIVGTDGSNSSLRAVDRAAQIAAQAHAHLIIATAYVPHSTNRRAADILKEESYQVAGNASVYATLQKARERAELAGADDIEERPIEGAPVEALIHLANQEHADLLVIGNLGLNSIAGRILGSVPAQVSRRSHVDVLIVHTTGR